MRRRSSDPVEVAYQGGPGANGEAAIAAHWKGAAQPVSMRSFPALVTAVADGMTDYGVVPLWNSAIGDLAEPAAAVAEAGDRVEQVHGVVVPVRHALLAVPGTPLHAIRAIGSHPAALAQCSRFLQAHPAAVATAAWDTAGAAMELATFARLGDSGGAWVTPWYAAVEGAAPCALAVIANRAVAEPLGLVVLADEIQDDCDNVTRFAILRARSTPWRW